MCLPCRMGIPFFLFCIEILPIYWWITWCSLLGRNLLDPYVEPYEDWKDIFVRVRCSYDTSMVTTRVIDSLRFHQSWTTDPHIIKGMDFSSHSPLEREVIQTLSCFQVMSSHTLITLGREDECGVDKYLGKIECMKGTF